MHNTVYMSSNMIQYVLLYLYNIVSMCMIDDSQQQKLNKEKETIDWIGREEEEQSFKVDYQKQSIITKIAFKASDSQQLMIKMKTNWERECRSSHRRRPRCLSHHPLFPNKKKLNLDKAERRKKQKFVWKRRQLWWWSHEKQAPSKN